MPVVVIDQNKCRPADCENGVCVAQFTCTWKVLEQSRPFALPEIDARRCLGCARCALLCPLGAIQAAKAQKLAPCLIKPQRTKKEHRE